MRRFKKLALEPDIILDVLRGLNDHSRQLTMYGDLPDDAHVVSIGLPAPRDLSRTWWVELTLESDSWPEIHPGEPVPHMSLSFSVFSLPNLPVVECADVPADITAMLMLDRPSYVLLAGKPSTPS